MISVWMATILGLATPADAFRIYGGVVSDDCAWPSVVSLGLRGCTATLVSPSVLVYSSHCGTNWTTAYLGHAGSGGSIELRECVASPRSGEKGGDFAYCVTARPIHGIPLAPIVDEAARGKVDVGREVVIVGYGANDIDARCGTKLEATSRIVSWEDGEYWIHAENTDACFGDSGGPAFANLDGRWTLIGTASFGDPECHLGTFYTDVADHMAWLRSQVELVESTCAEGCWQPGDAGPWCDWGSREGVVCGRGEGRPGGVCGWADPEGFACGGDDVEPFGRPRECGPEVVAGAPCGDLDALGCCDCNQNVFWCEDGVVATAACVRREPRVCFEDDVADPAIRGCSVVAHSSGGLWLLLSFAFAWGVHRHPRRGVYR